MKAAIDIGSNTVLLLVAENNTSVRVIREEQRMPRLGKGVDTSKSLATDSMKRVMDVLLEYRDIISTEYKSINMTDVIVTATSAVRDASNKVAFLDEVKKKTGFQVQILSGDEEAEYTFSGAQAVFDDLVEEEVFVLDIGGGSTEVALGREGIVKNAHSFDMGCVRFTERFLTYDPPTEEQINECREGVKKLLQSREFYPGSNVIAVGVAGTLTSLAAIDLETDVYEPDVLNGHRITREKLKKTIKIFSSQTYGELIKLSPNVLKGRVDVFLAGLLILEGFLDHFGLQEIRVSTGGIRHGAILRNSH